MLLAKVMKSMQICLPLAKKFIKFDASDMYSIEDEDFELIETSGHAIDTFILQGNDTWLLTIGKNFNDFLRPMINLTTLVHSATAVPIDLSFLDEMPKSLVRLQLDMLNFEAREFVTFLRPLTGQLDELAITSNSQLTCYDLVNILKWFWKLDKLDLRCTEYMRPGTVGTIFRYCYNLQVFFFSTNFKLSNSKAWVDLVECDYEYITFHDDFYKEVQAHKMFIEMGMDSDDSD